jgi:hypothetical protein
VIQSLIAQAAVQVLMTLKISEVVSLKMLAQIAGRIKEFDKTFNGRVRRL